METVKKIFSDKAIYARNIKDILKLSDILIIANPDNKFLELKRNDFYRIKHQLILIDCWRLMRNYQLSDSPNLKYIGFGIGI